MTFRFKKLKILKKKKSRGDKQQNIFSSFNSSFSFKSLKVLEHRMKVKLPSSDHQDFELETVAFST